MKKASPYLFLILAPFLALVLVVLQVYYTAVVWRYPGEDFVFEIRPNETFSSINSRLEKEKLIASARFFHRYSQYKGTMNKFKSGKYLIHKKSNLLDVYNTLLFGKTIANLVTIPEGRNMYEIAAMLQDRNITSGVEFLKLAKDIDFLDRQGIKAHTAEGYLYPDTYDFSENLSAEVVISAMINLFKKKTANIDFTHPKFTKEQIIILASMVEKETGYDKERPMIAAVFLNRLKKGMRLQSDPTTIYGIWERYDGNIRKKDLQEENDYNTYKIAGIPKGPITNPGVDAINAVLNPDKNDYLFFVSKNDGTHIFSVDYKAHQQAVEEWQRNTANRKGKSWRDLKKSAPASETLQ